MSKTNKAIEFSVSSSGYLVVRCKNKWFLMREHAFKAIKQGGISIISFYENLTKFDEVQKHNNLEITYI
jgi:hypothetical protein